jgi:hypothetical protein
VTPCFFGSVQHLALVGTLNLVYQFWDTVSRLSPKSAKTNKNTLYGSTCCFAVALRQEPEQASSFHQTDCEANYLLACFLHGAVCKTTSALCTNSLNDTIPGHSFIKLELRSMS